MALGYASNTKNRWGQRYRWEPDPDRPWEVRIKMLVFILSMMGSQPINSTDPKLYPLNERAGAGPPGNEDNGNMSAAPFCVQLRHSSTGRKQDRTGFRGYTSRLWQRDRKDARRARLSFLRQTFLTLCRSVQTQQQVKKQVRCYSGVKGNTFLFTLARDPASCPPPKKMSIFF